MTFGADNPMLEPVVFSPDSRLAAAQFYDGEETGEKKFCLRLWDIMTMKVVRTVARFSQGIRLMGFSPDGRELAVLLDNDLRRLQVETGKQLWTVPFPHSKQEMVCVFSPDSSKLFRGTGLAEDIAALQLEIWDAVQGKILHKLTPERPK